jgi:DNA-binding beta-propeller fold protein YncE
VDGAGNVYVADTQNNKIRKISASGVVITLAGAASSGLANGLGSAARFDMPFGVALDPMGNAYVADSGNTVVRKIARAP